MEFFSPFLVDNCIKSLEILKKNYQGVKKKSHIGKEACESDNKDTFFGLFLICLSFLQVSTIYVFTNFTMKSF